MIGSRDHFPDLAWRSYLDHAAVGPLPRPALDALHAAGLAQARRGVMAIADLVHDAHEVRIRLGELIGADADDVALTTCTSDGVVAVAQGLPWQRGDRILLFRGEFPTNTTPWQVAARQHGLEILWLDADTLGTEDGLQEVEDLCRQGIRMIAVSAVEFQTGLRTPTAELARIAHRHGGELFVDAIQALGSVPFRMDEGEVDYVATGGQKWLLGPVGTGALVARPERWSALRPSRASWLSHVKPMRYLEGVPGQLTYDQPLASGRALVEGGSLPLANHCALSASLGLLLEHGIGAVHAHIQAWIDAVEPPLVEAGFTSGRAVDPARRSGILSLEPPPGVALPQLVSEIRERGVSVSTPDGRLRLAPSWPTPMAEVEIAVDAITSALQALA